MAVYTTLLKTLIDINYDLGLKNYPIFNEEYRNTLNQSIIDYYKFYEIGYETPALFVDRLNAKMSGIMPYYNKLYTADENFAKLKPYENLNYDVIDQRTLTYNSKKSHTLDESRSTNYGRTSNTTQNGSNSSSTDTLTIFSDTPQNSLNIDNVKAGKYASTVNDQSDTMSGTTNNTTNIKDGGSDTYNTTETIDDEHTGTDTDSTIQKVNGLKGNKLPPEILIELRRTFLNIDMMVIEELKPLFMLVY